MTPITADLHTLEKPVTLLPLPEVFPGLPTFEALSDPRKHGERLYKNFVYRMYALLNAEQNRFDEQIVRCRARLKGQIIVDLGSGHTLDGYSLACGVEAKAYIAVEPHYGERFRENCALGQEADRLLEQIPLSGSAIPACLVETHAVEFLRALPDHSVSTIVSGIDRCVILDSLYRESLWFEISRTLHPQGACLTRASYSGDTDLLEEVISAGDNFSCLTLPS